MSTLESAWWRVMWRAIAASAIKKESVSGHVTEAMRQLYDHSIPVVYAPVKPKEKG